MGSPLRSAVGEGRGRESRAPFSTLRKHPASERGRRPGAAQGGLTPVTLMVVQVWLFPSGQAGIFLDLCEHVSLWSS